MKLESHFDQSGFTGFFVNSVKLGKVSKEYDITMGSTLYLDDLWNFGVFRGKWLWKKTKKSVSVYKH